MPSTNANGIQIEYETFGNSSKPAVLLIAGLGAQLQFWSTDFCHALSDRGFFVIRFDNRDVGFSSKMEAFTPGELMKKIGDLVMGRKTTVPYHIEDMAEDCVGLLDALKFDKAHLIGASMGGYIAQSLCIGYPSRVMTLTSIYSHPGNRTAFPPTEAVMKEMLTPAPRDREGYQTYMARQFKLIYGTGLPFDETFHRELAGLYFDRCFYPEGVMRQYVAVLAQKDRTQALSGIPISALVIHGDEDPLVPLAGGMATAEAMPNAVLKVIRGMGHVMPNLNAYWSEILDAVVNHIRDT